MFGGERIDHRVVFPAGIIKQGDEITGTKPQHPAQMRELLTVDDAAAPVNLFFRQKKTRHEDSIFSSQQQGYPFLPTPALQEAKFFSEKTNNGARSLIQDPRQNEISCGRYSSLQV